MKDHSHLETSDEVVGLVAEVLSHSLSNTSHGNEIEFLLDRISLMFPEHQTVIVWVDAIARHSAVSSRVKQFGNVIDALKTWTAEQKHAVRGCNFSNLKSHVTDLIADADKLIMDAVSLADSKLYAVALVSREDEAATVQLRAELRNALPIALVLQHQRISSISAPNASTLLTNREGFIWAVQSAIRELGHQEGSFAVAMIDLDRFLLVNDAFGPFVADEILEHICERILYSMSANDVVARLGGDELAIVVRDAEELEHLEETFTKLTANIRNPLSMGGNTVRVTASIGVTLWNPHVEHIHHLLRNANTALHYVKRHGKDGVRFFDESWVSDQMSHIAMEDELEKALARQDFRMVYQPRVDGASEEIESAEALIRWHHPERGVIYPGDFISYAEENRLIVKIGDWVISEVCRQLQEWKLAEIPCPRIAINVSPKQLVRTEFASRLVHWMHLFDIGPELLEIEITETALIEHGEEMLSTLQSLRDIGIIVSIDDFGTGYSTLEMLKQFPTDYLKIDKTFVHDMNRRTQAIVSMIIQLAHRVDSKVIAEGVETPDQHRFLVQAGCDELQGYLFSRPLSPEDFAALLGARYKGAS